MGTQGMELQWEEVHLTQEVRVPIVDYKTKEQLLAEVMVLDNFQLLTSAVCKTHSSKVDQIMSL
jgi:hypothetical protein